MRRNEKPERDASKYFTEYLTIQDGDRVFSLSQGNLTKNMKELVKLYAAENREFWAEYFYSNKADPLARKHLQAYLFHVAYWAAKIVHRQLKAFQHYPQVQYDLADLLQIGSEFVMDLEKFFHKFDPQQPIERYVFKRIEGKIRDVVFDGNAKCLKYSDWSLLKQCSKKTLKTALETCYREPLVTNHLLAWQCFKEVYTTCRTNGRKALPAPNAEQLQKMAKIYNKSQPSELVENPPQPPEARGGNIDDNKILQYFNNCIKALREYHFLLPKEEISPDDLLDNLAMKDAADDLHKLLHEHIENLNETTAGIFTLKYGQGLSDRSIAPLLKVNPSTVYRRHQPAKQKLLTTIVHWAKEQYGVTPDSKVVDDVLPDLLLNYYQNKPSRLAQKVS